MSQTKKKVELKEKSYRLLDGRSGEALMLNAGRKGDLIWFDKEEGIPKAIRHCPNEKSIFIDDQSKFALVTPVIFNRGILVVKPEEQSTQKFLEHHPDNSLNGGHWFEEINDELEAGEDIEVEELVAEIKQAVRDKGKEKDGVFALEMVASIITGSLASVTGMSANELKRVIYQRVDSNPYYFTDDEGNVTIFDDEKVQRTYITLRALSDGIIKKSPNKRTMLWANNKTIVSAPQGLDLVEYFSEYLSSDDGLLVIEEIHKRS